jgi:hypothetical protein
MVKEVRCSDKGNCLKENRLWRKRKHGHCLVRGVAYTCGPIEED